MRVRSIEMGAHVIVMNYAQKAISYIYGLHHAVVDHNNSSII